MTQHRAMNKRQEKYRGKMAREFGRVLVFLDNDAHRSAILIAAYDHQSGARVVTAIASISIVKSTQRENVGMSYYNVEGFVRLTGHALAR